MAVTMSLGTLNAEFLKHTGLLSLQGGLDLHLDNHEDTRQKFLVLQGARAIGPNPGMELFDALVGQPGGFLRHKNYLCIDGFVRRIRLREEHPVWQTPGMAGWKSKKGVATPKK